VIMQRLWPFRRERSPRQMNLSAVLQDVTVV
jgi:hypothetical protein